jgi:hypothetical protein
MDLAAKGEIPLDQAFGARCWVDLVHFLASWSTLRGQGLDRSVQLSDSRSP